jgi:hypothetical protein
MLRWITVGVDLRMGEDAHLVAATDRKGGFSGYYKCSLCDATFRPNPDNRQEMVVIFARHVELSHPSQKASSEKPH